MAASIIPDELWQAIQPLLPPRPLSRKGGRPPIGDREVLTGIIFVLKTGIPWEELPLELGCGCGMTCLRRLRSWQDTGIWGEVQRLLQQNLNPSKPINWKRLRTERSRRQESWDRACSSFQPFGQAVSSIPFPEC